MHRDAGLGEDLGVADPRQLQQMRRADRAGGKDHLARRIGPLGVARAAARNSTPAARVPSKITRCTSAPVTTCRLGRFDAGFR